MTGYDPRTNTITLDADASLYARFHELAHAEQAKSAKWRICLALRCIRVLEYFATLALEYNAMCRARRVMRRLGVWRTETEKEAWSNLSTYINRKEIPNVSPSLT